MPSQKHLCINRFDIVAISNCGHVYENYVSTLYSASDGLQPIPGGMEHDLSDEQLPSFNHLGQNLMPKSLHCSLTGQDVYAHRNWTNFRLSFGVSLVLSLVPSGSASAPYCNFLMNFGT